MKFAGTMYPEEADMIFEVIRHSMIGARVRDLRSISVMKAGIRSAIEEEIDDFLREEYENVYDKKM